MPRKSILMDYTEEEAALRTEAALRAAFNTPPKPQAKMKLGKPRAKLRKSPAKQKAKKVQPLG
jgi:hypothetical protein